ncbi:hypothetical protein ACSKGD_004550 [Vibrio parahaemolyticus]
MELTKIKYSDLSSKQREIFNFQKLAAVLADYGFNCIKLADDWLGADFLAYHKDGEESYRIQLKGRLTIDKKYSNKNLYMAFPIGKDWCVISHDHLVELVDVHTNWLNTESWLDKGIYHSAKPSKVLLEAISESIIKTT